MKWAEVRCGACVGRSYFSKVLLRYRVGSIAPGGQIVVMCRDCKAEIKLTTGTQEPDGKNTFYLPERTQVITVPRTA